MEYGSFWVGAFIFAAVIFGIIGSIMIDEYSSKNERKIGKVLILFAIILGCLTLFGTIKMNLAPFVWTKTANEKLISLNDNNMTNGRFYVRRGYINEDLWYQYMVDVGGGGYVANKVPSNGTTVYFDNENPRCEWYKVSQEWWIFKQWGIRWKLYVPEGTIGTNYTIDLQ